MSAMSTVRCNTCSRERTVSFSHCLRHGWPTCHGETMRLLNTPDEETVDRAVERAMAPATAAMAAARRHIDAGTTGGFRAR